LISFHKSPLASAKFTDLPLQISPYKQKANKPKKHVFLTFRKYARSGHPKHQQRSSFKQQMFQADPSTRQQPGHLSSLNRKSSLAIRNNEFGSDHGLDAK
jgi:hypothetical protein